MKRKGRIAALVLVGFLALSSFMYIKSSDNKNTAELPQEIITLNFEFTNVFLIPIEDGYLQIDNAYEKEYDLFLEYLKSRRIAIHDIKYVLLTHHHDDHVGFLNQIVAANSDVRVVLSRGTADLLRKGKNNTENGGGIVNSIIYALFRIRQIIAPDWDLTFPPYTTRDRDIVLTEEYHDLEGIPGVDIVAVHTPGHTSDSTTFIYNGHIAFCGDLASNFLNWAGAKYLTVFNENLDTVYGSWQKLIDSNIKIIATAHGKPFHIKNLEENIFKNSQSDIVRFF